MEGAVRGTLSCVELRDVRRQVSTSLSAMSPFAGRFRVWMRRRVPARFGEREDSHVSRSRQSPGLDGGRGNWDRRGIIEPEVIGDVETTFIGSV